MSQKAYIRADGDSQIGLGHLVRCVAIAHMLKGLWNINFVCQKAPENIKNEIKESGFIYINIKREDEFLQKLTSKDIVILDHYGLDSAYQKKIKEIGCKLVCIDDLHDKDFFADLIINHAPGVKPESYKVQPYTQLALGPEYALLRPEFLKIAQRYQPDNNTSKNGLMICFGGSDYKNITTHTLKEVLNRNEFNAIFIVTGSSFMYENDLKTIVNTNSNIVEWYSKLSSLEMLGIMKKAKYAIVPASGILYETLAVRMIVISGIYVENQCNIYNGFKEKNVFTDAGDFTPKALHRALDSLTELDDKARAFRMKQLIDGNSSERILNLFKSLKYVHSDIDRQP